jgi:transposase
MSKNTDLAVPTRRELEAFTPADRWTLEDKLDDAQGILRKFNDDELRKWIEVEGKTQTEVAKIVGRSRSRIAQRATRLGLTPKRGGRPRELLPTLTIRQALPETADAASDAAVREVGRLGDDPEELREAWEAATEQVEDGKPPTAKQVRKVVEAVKPPKPKRKRQPPPEGILTPEQRARKLAEAEFSDRMAEAKQKLRVLAKRATDERDKHDVMRDSSFGHDVYAWDDDVESMEADLAKIKTALGRRHRERKDDNE